MIRILIADDHPVVREGLKQIVRRSEDVEIAAEALNGQEVLDQVAASQFDVIVLDMSMPGKDGFEVLRELRRDHPKLPVLVLSMHPEDQLGIRVLKAGAAGYMNKESAPRELVQAIRKVHAGGKYVSATLAEKLAIGIGQGSVDQPHELLSDREFQVLTMLASGRTPNDIADELSISVKTVRTYRERVFEKVGVKTDVELVHYALRHNLIQSS